MRTEAAVDRIAKKWADSIRMPQVGHLYPRRGGGFLSLYIAMSGQVSARLMADRFDVGFTTGLMPVASFWEMCA